MAIIKCTECERKASITFCSETGDPLCGDCSVSCKACHKPLSRKKAHLTSTGRTLCTKCMAERNAQRKARKEHEATKSKKQKKASEAAGAAPAATSFSGLAADEPAKPKVESFASLTADDPPAKPGTSFSSLGADDDVDMMGSGGASAEDGGEDELDEAGRPKTYGLEGAAGEGGSRLELPPIDEHRPILNSSGYQSPSKLKYFLAFLFFGVAGVVFYSRSDVLHDIMWPYKTTGLKYNSSSELLMTDSNQLRDTSNLNQLDLFSQAPIFFVTWVILITYLGGSAWIIISTVRSYVSSTIAKRRMKKAEEAAKSGGYSFPG